MKTKMILSIGLTAGLTALLSACSAGGGSASSGSTSGKASGPLSIPSATCNGSPCLGQTSLAVNSVDTLAQLSGNTVFNFANLVYTHFTETVIPGVNTVLYKVEQVATENNLKTCEDIAAAGPAGGALGYPLGGGYTVDISDMSGDLKTIPAPMTDNGQKMTKRFIFLNSGMKFAEVQIKCNSTTERTFYVRIQESASKTFEFWSQSDGNKRIIYGAMDNGSSEKTSFYFNTADGSTFELHGVARQVAVAGATMDFSIAGGANISAGKADIIYVQDGSVPTATATYSPDDAGTVHPRHCYSSFSPLTVDASGAACNNLLHAATAPDAVRSGTAWDYLGMATPISTSF